MEKMLMGGVVVYVTLTLVAYFLIVLKIPFLIIPIVILCAIIFFKRNDGVISKIRVTFNLQTIWIFVVFGLGILGQLAVISPSGIFQNGDLIFWSAHGHDASWHIALMEEIKRGWPLQNPVFAGEKLVNYHFFSDILPAILSKYLSISNLVLYFRIFPFIYSLFLGVSVYYLTKKITGNSFASLWATIFTYFAGSFGYLIGKGESVFWATQPQSSSGNPPQIISNFLVLSYFYFTISLSKKFDRINFLSAMLILGTIAMFKVYAGIVLFASTFVAGVWEFFKNKKYYLLGLFAVSTPMAAFLYLPNSSGASNFLIFQPWWYIRTMIVEPSRLNLVDWELRRQTYIHEQNWKRIIFLESLGFLIFFFGNLGMRFLGIVQFFKQNILISSAIVISFVLPLLFLQKGVATNTSQFLQYFILLFGILAGITVAKIIQSIKSPFLKFVTGALIILLMIPTQIGLLQDFYSRPAFAKISKAELEALTFLKENTDPQNVILTPPYNPALSLEGNTPNIWDWFDTSYVSAISARRTYMDDYEQNDIMGYDYRKRNDVKKIIFSNENPEVVSSNLSQTKADIVYFPKLLSPKIKLDKIDLSKFYENQEVEIWKIK